MNYHKMSLKQKGIGLVSLLMWSVVLVLIVITSLRIAPAYIEYSAIKKNLSAIAKDTSLQNTNLNQIRLAFSRRAQIDDIKSISGQDIKISRENGRVILSVGYTEKIPLFSNVSLSIDFEAVSD
ncbi:protein of unknown function [Nitrosomonas ureae]|uniref:DUF4845 domain-containing protein n=2 Tax=Nitrosomonas ureae TaxID=44577 RepID=A0A0S3AJ66_9PROT|nr:hypothetical protein ATY38_07990 [Nitrosomonas ureae]PXX13401.1 uncharacterized protein DUF4845 [Nitrosomonas ureae]SDU06331.1 protein of unknown function [Nitrosomonas ureae]SEQ41526.1 protein of unknown function [Nitrosomonas ureae]